MPWFQVDDKVYAHPKFIGLTLAATGLWMRAGAWCAQNLTDGWLPETVLPLVCGGEPPGDLVRQLEGSRLWIRGVNGWQFNDWTDWNRSREWHEQQRAAARERKRRHAAKGNAKRWDNAETTVDGQSPDVTAPPQGNAVKNALLTSPNPTQLPVVQVPVHVEVVGGSDRSAINNRAPSNTDGASFTSFWNIAVRKVGKGAARKAFDKALTRATERQIAEAWISANAAWKSWPDKTVVPHPATWLNQERWDDDPPQPHQPAGGKLTAAAAQADRMALMEGSDHDPSRHLATAHPGSGLRPNRPAIGP